MTVIAWDGKTLAADRQVTRNDQVGSRIKLKKLDSGTIIVFAGDTDRGLMLMDWFTKGEDPAAWPSFQRAETGWVQVIIAKNGHIYEYNQEPVGIPVETPYWAWGSGSSFALGALAMGATAVQAVEAASKHCNTCGLGIDSFNIPEEE